MSSFKTHRYCTRMAFIAQRRLKWKRPKRWMEVVARSPYRPNQPGMWRIPRRFRITKAREFTR